MDWSKENDPEMGLIRSTSTQGSRDGFGSPKLVKGPSHDLRRPLSSINQNIIGTSMNPSVVNKKVLAGKDVIAHSICTLVRDTEAKMGRMREVEMKDVEEEEEEEDEELDIDYINVNNPLEVVEYIDDIYTFYMKLENSSCVSPTYMDRQFDINKKMRAILIDWLIERAATGKLTGVYRKYGALKFSCVAKHEPAHFLLNL